MSELFASGRLIDIALVVVGLETLALLAVGSRAGIRPMDVIGQMLAGAFLLVAVRLAITGADYRWTLLLVTLSLPAHAFDLVRRAKRSKLGAS